MNLFDIAKSEEELSKLEEKTANPDFWTTNNEETKKVLSEIKKIKSKVIKYRELEKEINDSLELSELVKESFEEELLKDIIKSTKKEHVHIFMPMLCLIKINLRHKKALNDNVQCFFNILSINQKESNVKSEVEP